MSQKSPLQTQEDVCPTCLGHVPNGETRWMSGSTSALPCSSMSEFRASKERGCLLCSLLFHAVEAVEPEMIVENQVAQIVIGSSICIRLQSLGMPWGLVLFASPHVSRRWPGMKFGPENIYSSDFASEECFAQINGWIQRCVHDHVSSACSNSEPSVLPKRVLDLGANDIASVVKLVETNGELGAYTTLSHRWGTNHILSTTAATLPDRLAGIAFNTLSRTFQDAVIVTRRIGVRYLWIDSLCIVQDDIEDWEIESSKMGQIYTNSFLTIAAASESSKVQGFLNSRELFAGIKLKSAEDPCGELDIIAQKQMIHSQGDRDPSEETTPLLTRGWALQEDILSRRLLTYYHDEMTWQCVSANTCECRGGQFRDNEFTSIELKSLCLGFESNSVHLPGKIDEQRLKYYKLWRDLVSRYTHRDLTYASDLLPALSGIAKAFSNTLNDQYFGGMWRGDLMSELVWAVDQDWPMIGHGKLAGRYRAPSFSWSSIDSYGTDFADVDIASSKLDCALQMEVIDVKWTARGRNPMGDLSDGYLKVRGLMFATTPRFGFLRSKAETRVCHVSFYPDTRLGEGDAILRSGENLHTAKRLPGAPRRHTRARASSEAERMYTPARSKEIMRIFEVLPKDIDKINIWAMLICDGAGQQIGSVSQMRGDNSHKQGLIHGFGSIASSSFPFHAYYFLILGASFSKPGTFERLGLLRLENEGNTDWIEHGTMTEIEII